MMSFPRDEPCTAAVTVSIVLWINGIMLIKQSISSVSKVVLFMRYRFCCQLIYAIAITNFYPVNDFKERLVLGSNNSKISILTSRKKSIK